MAGRLALVWEMMGDCGGRGNLAELVFNYVGMILTSKPVAGLLRLAFSESVVPTACCLPLWLNW